MSRASLANGPMQLFSAGQHLLIIWNPLEKGWCMLTLMKPVLINLSGT